jgi:hypothetical protein
MTLPLGLPSPPLGIGRYVAQATGILLSHLSSLAHLHKLTLEKGNLLNKALYILASRV